MRLKNTSINKTKPLLDSEGNLIKGVTTTLDYLPFGTDADVKAEMLKTKKEQRKLPEGVESKSLYSDIIRITWPSMLELFLTSLVSMVDMMMVSGLGSSATTAIGLANQPRFLILTTLMALNTGATAIIARARGSGRHELTNQILRQAMVLATGISIICGFLGVYFSGWMINFMANGGMQEATIKAGTRYLQIQMAAFPLFSWSFCITAALRGTGNTKPSMIYNITANLVNIFLNYLLINGHWGFPALGVAGASLATVISQLVATIIALYCVFSGKFYLKLRLKNLLKFDKRIVGDIAKIGLPAMLEQVVMRIGMVIYSRTVATLGEVANAAFQICMNIQSLSMMNGQSFAVAATTLTGQSLGRRRLDLAEHYGIRCRNLGLCIALFLSLIFAIFGKYLVMLYNSKELAVIQMGTVIMIIVALLQPFMSSQFILGGLLRGAGDTKSTAIIMLITVVIIRTSVAYVFVSLIDYSFIAGTFLSRWLDSTTAGGLTEIRLYGAWIAVLADQMLRSWLILLRYNQGKWKEIRLL